MYLYFLYIFYLGTSFNSFGDIGFDSWDDKQSICQWHLSGTAPKSIISVEDRKRFTEKLNSVVKPSKGYGYAKKYNKGFRRPYKQKEFIVEELRFKVIDDNLVHEEGILDLAKTMNHLQVEYGLRPLEQINIGGMYINEDGLFPLSYHNLESVTDLPLEFRYYVGRNSNLEFHYWAYSMANGIMPINTSSSVFGHDLGHIEEFARFPEITKLVRLFYRKMLYSVNGEPSYVVRELKKQDKYKSLDDNTPIEKLLLDDEIKDSEIESIIQSYRKPAELMSEDRGGRTALLVYDADLSEEQFQLLIKGDSIAKNKLKKLLETDSIFHHLGGASRDVTNIDRQSSLGKSVATFLKEKTDESYQKIIEVIKYSYENKISVESFIKDLSSYGVDKKTSLAFQYLDFTK